MEHEAIYLHLGARLRRRRLLLGLSQEAVAAHCGVTFQTIQKYESAEVRMSATNLWLIAQALDVPVSYFFDGAEPFQRNN